MASVPAIGTEPPAAVTVIFRPTVATVPAIATAPGSAATSRPYSRSAETPVIATPPESATTVILRPTIAEVPVIATAPAAADEFTDTLQSALDAYEAGDVDGASADLEYAGKLLTAMKAESLKGLLPAALPGWTRAEADAAESSGFMGMLGGGTAAAATYSKGTDELTITLVANSPMVSGIGAAKIEHYGEELLALLAGD